MTTQQKKEAIAAAIQAAKTIVDLLCDAGYTIDDEIVERSRALMAKLRIKSEKLKEEN